MPFRFTRCTLLIINKGGNKIVRKNQSKRIPPVRLLVIGYFIITFISAVLLSLPVSVNSGQPQNFVDALFVAFSGISTTGLTVVDVSSFYSLFGQLVLLCTFQIGGIGYMALVIIIINFMNKKNTFLLQNTAQESMAGYENRNLLKFSALIILSTMIIELSGAFGFFLVFKNDFPLGQAVYYSVFHSISAFCTAGFSVFPDSFMHYQDNAIINLTIIIVSYLGAIGFIVIYDLLDFFKAKIKGRPRSHLKLHSKFVLLGFTVIILIGTAVILLSEQWPDSVRFEQRIMRSAFQSISASTTDGFNTMNIGSMSPASLTFFILQMFVGAAPGSTGGGIKITTLVLLLLFIFNQLKGRENTLITIGRREIQNKVIERAIGIIGWFLAVIFIDVLVMVNTEKSHAGYLQILFEITSALGNTGLSAGITMNLSMIGKLMLTFTMFVGRVGPLTLGFALARKEVKETIRYPEEELFIG
jgi:trk system potassium uptake protein TrkH